MKNSTKDLAYIKARYDTHTLLFSNVIEGISDFDINERFEEKANHIAWLIGSTVQLRFELSNLLGIELYQSAHELFKDSALMQDNITYPSVAIFNEDWKMISPVLVKEFNALEESNVYNHAYDIPDEYGTLYDLFHFIIIKRETEAIRNIQIWRSLLIDDRK